MPRQTGKHMHGHTRWYTTYTMFNIVHSTAYMVFFYLCCYGYSLAVFVGWFVIVDWNSGLIFTLHQLITILSHELIKHTHREKRQIIQR